MCRSLSTKVVLSYALSEHETVTGSKLQKKRQELIASFGDVLADVSFASIRQTVHELQKSLTLCVSEMDCSITRNTRSDLLFSLEGGLLPGQYLDACLSGCFSKEEKETIKKILKS